MLWLFWGQGLSIEWIPIFKAHILNKVVYLMCLWEVEIDFILTLTSI